MFSVGLELDLVLLDEVLEVVVIAPGVRREVASDGSRADLAVQDANLVKAVRGTVLWLDAVEVSSLEVLRQGVFLRKVRGLRAVRRDAAHTAVEHPLLYTSGLTAPKR